jgi:hypothetical protein
MKLSHSVRIALLFGLLLVALAAILVIKSGRAESHSASTSLPDLEYLKAINSVGPPQDPQLLFLLMTQYANANRQGEGAEFFSVRLKEFEPKLTPVRGLCIWGSSACYALSTLRHCRSCADIATLRRRWQSSSKQSSYREARFSSSTGLPA